MVGRSCSARPTTTSTCRQDTLDKRGFTAFKLQLREKPLPEKCPLFRALLDCCGTPAERRFANIYYTWAVCGENYPNPGYEGQLYTLGEVYGKSMEEGVQAQLGWEDWSLDFVTRRMHQAMTAPALIPQAWLCFEYDPNLPPASRPTSVMPKRVDFLFTGQDNRLHVIEIDDPSHYAFFDKRSGTYEVSEEKYTQNLRAERALKGQGIEIHRMSNKEVLSGSEEDVRDLIESALGIGKLGPQVDSGRLGKF